MCEAGPADVESEIDVLYAGPLAEFVAQRKALAARLRSAGEPEAARRVSGLPRPSATAWALNQLHWQRRECLDAVRESGDRVRRAHEGDAAAGTLSEALAARRAALSEAVRAGLEALAASGRGTGLAVERRLRGSLEAVAAGSDSRSGRLVADLDPPSFDALSGLSPALVRAPPAAASSDLAEKSDGVVRDDGAEERRLAEAELARLGRQLERAAESERAARVRAEAARAEIGEAEGRLERARRRSGEAEDELERHREETRAVREALDDARRRLEGVRG